MRQIKWRRPFYDTETGKSIYEDSTGRFAIHFLPDHGDGYGACWYATESDGSPCELEPRCYLQDIKRACEVQIEEDAR